MGSLERQLKRTKMKMAHTPMAKVTNRVYKTYYDLATRMVEWRKDEDRKSKAKEMVK